MILHQQMKWNKNKKLNTYHAYSPLYPLVLQLVEHGRMVTRGHCVYLTDAMVNLDAQLYSGHKSGKY